MAPSNLARLIVNRLNHAFAPHVVIGSGPSVLAVCRLGEIDTPAWVGIHNEQPGLWIEAWRSIVRKATLIRSDDAPVRRRLLGWIRDRMSFLVDSQGPVHRAVR